MYLPKALIERLINDGDGLESGPMGLAIQEDLASMAKVLPYAAEKGAKFMVQEFPFLG